MGKRELLIAVIFVAAGAMVYEVAAPPKTDGQGFSLARFFANARRHVAVDAGHASYTRHGTFELASTVTEIRIARATDMVRVVGEDRKNLEYDLAIDSTGTDDAAALASAQGTTLDRDDLGADVTFTVTYPAEGRQTSQVLLRVPARLIVWVDGTSGAGADLRGVHGVHLDGVAGDTVLSSIAGDVTGTFHGGRLTIDGVGGLTTNLQSAETTIRNAHGHASVTLRAGSCRIERPFGPVDVDATNADVTIDAPTQPVHVGGAGGRATVTKPRGEVTIDGRRTSVALTLDAAIAATIVTTDEPVHVTLDGPPSISLDAVASDGGTIEAGDFSLHVDHQEDTARLVSPVGAGGPRVILRDQRADIVIARMK